MGPLGYSRSVSVNNQIETGGVSTPTSTATTPPSIPSTASAPSQVGSDWIYRLEQHFGVPDTHIGKMVRDIQTTFRVVEKALQTAGKKSYELIVSSNGIRFIPTVLAALVGNALYGTSLLTLALVKSVVNMVKITLDVVGIPFGDVGEEPILPAFIGGLIDLMIFFPVSAVLVGLGRLGETLIQSNALIRHKSTNDNTSTKLTAALEQSASSIRTHFGVNPLLIQENSLEKKQLIGRFKALDELGIDFNQKIVIVEDPKLLLLIDLSHSEEFTDHAIQQKLWSSDRVKIIRDSLKEAGVWDKLFPETQQAIEDAAQ